MADQDRLFGEDVELRFLRAAGVEQSLTDCHEFSVTDELVVKEFGYLGEANDRHTTIYKSTKGTAKFHVESGDAFRLKQDLIDRGRRKLTYFKVNALSTFVFPNGDVVRIAFLDLQISNIKTEMAKRDDFIEFSFDWVVDAPKTLDM
jgi:hypothetical protein